MESPGSGAADCSVGSIVWVRRRNGSWWPGKILGPEELSVSHLLSPRSGTPVKLLGREDASVDWYNLEKSKRVKAFRCGEFDDCIERAESSQGTPIKKREKYARREDAILHALELEKQLLNKQGKFKLGASSDQNCSNSSGGLKKEPLRSSAKLGKYKGKCGNSKSHHQDEIIGSPLCLEKVKEEENHSNWEDDNSEATTRMRGVQDFGIRIASSKRKLSSSASPNGFERPSIDSTCRALPAHGLSMGSANHGNGIHSTSFSGAVSRAKRSKCVYLPTECSDSLGYEETPANHNDVSLSQFGEGNFRPHLKENASGFMEDVDSDSSDTNSSKSDSNDDSSETEPETDKEMAVLSEADPYGFRRPEALGEYKILSNEEPDEPANSGDIALHYPVPSNEAVSKWKSKGKRNARNLPRRYTNRKVSYFGQRTLRHNLGFLGNDGFGGDWNEMDAEVGNGAYPLGRYWEDKEEYFDPNFVDAGNGMSARPILVDVDLKVQASYQKEPVPIVSLMSKLNGKAIIGHPIQIETLEDGSTETLVSTISNETFDDGSRALPQAWRTARRSIKKAKKVRKSSSTCGQKTRTLSSIGVLVLEPSNRGVVKGESMGVTTVACIPIKLVFSRLLEKINRPHHPINRL